MSTDPSASPWSSRARWVLTAVTVIGAIGLAVAYAGAADEDSLDRQVLWLDLAIVATVTAGSAQALWLIGGRRAVSMRRRMVLAHRSRRTDARPETPTAAVSTALVTVAGTPWVHRASCALAVGKAPGPAPKGTAAPCPVCLP